MCTNVLLTTASLLALIPTSWDSNVKVFFHVQDDSGSAVSNAVIKTYTRRDRIASMGHASSPRREIIAVTDGNGRAEVGFPCYDGLFSSTVHADNFYSETSGDVSFRRARDGIVIEHLLEHEKNVYFRLRPIVDPIPCFGYGAGDRIKLPEKNGRFGFDMEKGSWVPPHGKGEIADFWIMYDETSTNECAILEFDGMFNGAYKQTQRPSTSFKSTYRADTNHVYMQRMTIWTWRREGNDIYQSQFVSNDEYLVMRSRSVVDAEGNLKSCNYSKIYGGIFASGDFKFMTMVFNPKKNDANLEFDTRRNLRRKTSGILLP